MKMTYILAEKNGDSYDPVEISDDLSIILDDMEYEDVRNELYQVWEYPSGLIKNVSSDRELADTDDKYSVPHASKTIWLPRLTVVAQDEGKVRLAYASFSG